MDISSLSVWHTRLLGLPDTKATYTHSNSRTMEKNHCGRSVGQPHHKEYRVCITGHRPKKLPGGYDWDSAGNVAIRAWMRDRLHEYMDDRDVVGCTGMALGADQFFAHVCRDMGVRYTAFIPCRDQDGFWPPRSRARYGDLCSSADNVVMVSNGPYSRGCMQTRNLAMRDWLLGGDGVLLAVWDGSPGGTKNMVDACRDVGIHIVVYDP